MTIKPLPSRPIAIEFFCGAGGMSLGIERAGFDIALAVDYDGYHVATHERNFPYGKSLCASVQDLSGADVIRLADCKGEVDLVFGGPPCQGFSNMGLRDADDPRNSLIFHFARLIKEIRPKAFVMENVPGLNMGATVQLFEAFLKTVQSSYDVTLPVRVLDASSFGVPQARRRLFVMGIRRDIGRVAAYPILDDALSIPTVIQAIGDLPPVENDETLLKGDVSVYPKQRKALSLYAKRARGLLEIPNDFGHRRVWDKTRVTGCQRVKHTESALALYSATAPGGTVPGHKLPRLHPGGICPTLRAGATSERGSHTAPRPVHPVVGRVITTREAARLHGYPDWFGFYPAKVHSYRQIGNSVCPPVAHAVGTAVMQALGIDPREVPRRTIKLEAEFKLPADRPPQHARIPVKVEYPKIINYLWGKAYDARAGTLTRSTFGPKDIRDAIAKTGAKVPRVRPERFLYEAAQQRAIRDVLAVPLSHGYSIAIVDKDAGTGRFQAANADRSLGKPTSVTIRSAELRNALPVRESFGEVATDAALLKFIEREDFAQVLSVGAWHRLEVSRNLFGVPESVPIGLTVIRRRGASQRGYLQIVDGASTPHVRIQKILRQNDKSIVLVVFRLTSQHVGACVVRAVGGDLEEVFRAVFTNGVGE